ncbi:MAG: hypothetical protein WCI03_00770 [bacterium]|jgi:hypothetical protein
MDNDVVKKLIEAVFTAPPDLQEKALIVLRGDPVHQHAHGLAPGKNRETYTDQTRAPIHPIPDGGYCQHYFGGRC